MGNIRQKRPNEGPNLNVNRKEIWQSLNKKLGIKVEKSMVFKTLKILLFLAILRNKSFSGKPLWAVNNLVLPKSSRSHNPKTVKHIQNIFGIQSESMKIN